VCGCGHGQWPYPGHRFGPCQGQCLDGQSGAQGPRRRSGGPFARYPAYQCNGQKKTPIRRSKDNKAAKEQQSITAGEKELQAIKSRNKKWSKDQDQRPGAGNKGSKYTSNKTHYSPTDPDARISVKPGKARKLNYLSQLTVDTAHHVITDIRAYHADGKDNQQLMDIVARVQRRLWKEGLLWENCVADTGYSSGENYAFLEERGLRSFIPPHGTYKGGPDGFIYNEGENHYICPKGRVIPFTKEFLDSRTKTKKKEYRARKHVCMGCPIRESCLGKSAQEKKFGVTYYRAEYERNIARVNSPQGRYMKGKRQSTVEPVFGTLTPVHGPAQDQYIRIKTGQQVHVLIGHCLQLEEIPEVRSETGKKWGGRTCFALYPAGRPIDLHSKVFKPSKNQDRYCPTTKKALVKRLIEGHFL